MPDVPGVDPMRAKELRLKRENAKQLIDGLPHSRQSALAPSPNLRGDQINHGNSEPFQVACQPEMKIRTIRQDGHVRPFLFSGADQLAILAVHARNMLDHFHKPDHRDACGIHHGANPGALHALPSTSEKLKIGMASAESSDQTGGVKVARGFAGGNEYLLGHYSFSLSRREPFKALNIDPLPW